MSRIPSMARPLIWKSAAPMHPSVPPIRKANGVTDAFSEKGRRFKGRVWTVGADAEEIRNLCDLLAESGFEGLWIQDLDALREALSKQTGLAVILDLDTVPVDNRAIRNLTARFPATSFFCMSRERYHPDLSEAIRNHFYACLAKPLDPDELLYLLRCAADNSVFVRPSP